MKNHKHTQTHTHTHTIPKVLTLFSLFFISIFLFSCQPKESVIELEPDANESLRSAIEKGLTDLKSGEFVKARMDDEDCEPERENCIELSQSFDVPVDISHCEEGTFMDCNVIGTVNFFICIDTENPNLPVEVVIHESVFAHYRDCFDHEHLPHVDGWECITAAFHDAILDDIMQIVFDILDDDLTGCDFDNQRVLSHYIKKICTVPCVTDDGFQINFSWEQCGLSSACCIETKRWCENEDGSLNTVFIEKNQVGTCSAGANPCPPEKGTGEFPVPACSTRECADE